MSGAGIDVRLVLAVSLDGRLAPPGGGAAQLGGTGDRLALEEALAWADACLLGARTLRRHGTTCLIRQGVLLERRRRERRSPQPVAVVASRIGSLDPALPFFHQPLQRWLLSAAPAAAPGFHRHIPFVGWSDALQRLAAAGIARLALLGGAELASALLGEGLVNELQLTLCPMLLGGPHVWVGTGALPLPAVGWTLLEHRPLGGEELLLRYRRSGSGSPLSSPGSLPPPGAD